jgi:DNA-binding SARP family transcriptional activator
VNRPTFEVWLMTERERLRGLAIEALGRLRTQQAREDDEAGATAPRLLGLDPVQETVHRALMRTAAAGHRERWAASRPPSANVAQPAADG